jgi:serine/threonine-protein kinase
MENTRVSHYEVRRLLGRGGMGEVYEALDLELDRLVALKFIAPELSSDHDTLKRFEREARSAASLHHPHIATLHAFEREGARPFIDMELVAGPSLRERIDAGPFPLDQALAVARDVAAALAVAHRRGIAHRDIKPENLMFDEHGAIKVMDFGLAQASRASRITLTGTSMGTPAYMAPESLRARTDDSAAAHPADVFALGLVLHEMLTGRQVFRRDSPMATMYAIANEEAPPIQASRPEVEASVEDLVRRMLDKDPATRVDAAVVARELGAMTGAAVRLGDSGDHRPAPFVAASTGATTIPVADTHSPTQAMTPTPPRRPVAAIAVLAGVAVATGLGFVLLASTARGRQRAAIALNNRGHEALERGDRGTAQALFAAALARDPRYTEARINLGEVYLQKGELDSAAFLYQDVIRHSRDARLTARAYYQLGEVDMRGGSWESAVEQYANSLSRDSSSARGYNNYGVALVNAGRADEAVRLLARGTARFPNEPFLWKNAGAAALAVRDPHALEYLDRALELEPAMPEALGLRARARARAGDRAGALADWSRFIASPSTPDRAAVEQELRALGVLP